MKPWYREPWPWILMSGPAAAVVAGAATVWIAMSSSDGLVAEDYYRKGLSINKVIGREQAARELGVSAEIVIEAGRVRVRLDGQSPEALFAHFTHGTRAGHDMRLRLARTARGVYESELPELIGGHWQVAIEDPKGGWRIAKELR